MWNSTPSIELAWAAGFFDGEGSTYRMKHIRTRGKYKYLRNEFRVELGQSDIYGIAKTLIRFRDAVQLGSISGPFSTYKLPYYRWVAQGDNARQVLRLLWPYLGEVKRQQATNAGYEEQYLWQDQYPNGPIQSTLIP